MESGADGKWMLPESFVICRSASNEVPSKALDRITELFHRPFLPYFALFVNEKKAVDAPLTLWLTLFLLIPGSQ